MVRPTIFLMKSSPQRVVLTLSAAATLTSLFPNAGQLIKIHHFGFLDFFPLSLKLKATKIE